MLAIRMQRTGRKGHAMFRVVVQEARLTPSSGRVVAQLGHFDPHTKTISLEKEKASFYLKNGAQPSDRVARLLQQEGIELPGWVSLAGDRKRTVRNPEKLRRNRPAEAKAEEAVAETASESAAESEAETAEPQTEPEAGTETPVAPEDQTEE